MRVALALILTAVAGLTTACGTDEAPVTAPQATQTAADGSTFTAADVAFATAMIPHHAQALEMTDLARGRPLDPGVKEAIKAIRVVQPVEIEQMVDWLVAWGEPIPATSRDHVNADGSGDMTGMEGMDELPGMMSQDSMEALGEADDSAFESMFLEMMIEHHEGAIAMAVAEQDDGLFPDALTLAAGIEESQRAEVARMRNLLDQLG